MPEPQTQHPTHVREIADLVHQHLDPRVIDAGGSVVLVHPKEHAVTDIQAFAEKYREHPRRAQGVTRVDTAASLIEHTLRFKTEDTVAYFDAIGDAKAVTVVFNEIPSGSERGGHGDHRAVYRFPFSSEWQRWTKVHEQQQAQQAFAELLEDGASDMVAPSDLPAEDVAKIRIPEVGFATPAEILALGRGLSARVETRVANRVSLQNGADRFVFESEHRTESGDELRVPGAFVLAIPVFEGGGRFALAVRLRYRIGSGQSNAGTVTWRVILHHHTDCVRLAVEDVAAKFREATGVPVIFGAPRS